MNALDYLDIKIEDVLKEKVILTMVVDVKHLQPFGLMHGGMNAVLIETATSIGSNESIDTTKQVAVGLDIQVNHLKSAVKGDTLTVVAVPDHIGKTTQVWQAEITNQKQQKVSVGRCTLMVKNK
ncbi:MULTISPECIES: PaaI family thioesterase [Enterococcaceae]|uniref:PaaI family thioesterase n=1 Tax=Enterococcaceae TaxID=81852 RepID=UPI000E4BE689|nr:MULTISPECIES: PaaI family thioesterase [Enterococcaceae]RGI32039.1 PaaI family thioesterase [Melissococcus sp. OM08-11BH]UNM89743.1 PaaI family thioesterase [Vagococcus sp. CY52-2]